MRTLPPKFLAAMIAVLPLPGSPLYNGDDQRVMDQALADLEVYKNAGADSVIFENDHDLPYIQPPLDEKGIALMTKIVKAARERFEGPIGIQMLEAANITSLEIAAEADLDYIRAEAYVFAHVGGSGIINGSAGKILRRRKELQAEHIRVFADVKKKHGSHSLTIDLDIAGEIMQAEFFLVDGVIVTGQFTGVNPDKNDLIKAKRATKLPVLIGSGLTAENIPEYLPLADGFIVGVLFSKGREVSGKAGTRQTTGFHEGLCFGEKEDSRRGPYHSDQRHRAAQLGKLQASNGLQFSISPPPGSASHVEYDWRPERLRIRLSR